MDGNRFDALSKKLATRPSGTSRRSLIAAAAAGLAGAIRLRAGAGAQVSQAACGNKRCAKNPGVCADGCVCCVYGNGNSRCRPAGWCAPGVAVCPPGELVDPTLGCVQCLSRDDCPDGLGCFGGKCAQCPDGVGNCPGGPCGTGNCVGGVCGPLIPDPDSDGRPCQNMTGGGRCNAGVCV